MPTQRNQTILARLAEESRKSLEDGFDQSKVRKKIVGEKSMFKGDLSLKLIFNDEKALKAKLTGEKQPLSSPSEK